MPRAAGAVAAIVAIAALAGCATAPGPAGPAISATEGRARVERALPDGVADRKGWATDIYAALASLEIAPTPDDICAVIAIAGQESGFRADPAVPGLAKIAWKEIERRRERAGVPKIVLDAALALPSTNGKSYAERIDAVKTERQLSEIYDDFIGRIPLAKTFFADSNPVRTGGPMQVSVAFAESLVATKPYPYPMHGSVRDEVFTRRGGLYFGTAHLLDYRAPYDRHLYRFADFNAGRYASRNAAFQHAVTELSGIPVALDGDLVRYDGGHVASAPGNTELATRVLARRLDMTDDAIHRDLALEASEDFERTRLYARVFALADRAAGRPAPRAVVPQIRLESPKITRRLTTAWFAQRVDGRFRTCLGRVGA